MNNKHNLELAREYYKLAPMASVTNYALLVVTLIFYWGMLPATILLTWVGVNCVGATSFFVAVRLFKRYGTENNAVSWLRLYAYLVLFQEAPWGLIGPISFMIESELYRLLTLFMLGGMGAGAIISRAPVFKIYVISLVSLLTPIIITLALQRSTVTDAMLALVVIYLLFMLAVAKSYSATINRNIRLWLDNEQLVTQLRASHAEVEQANRVLTQEIEHRKEVEVELTKAKERSEQASEAKNRFLATVSHELRTPLNGIMGFADLLLEEKLELRQQHYAGQISKAGHALLRIVNDILDITAIEAGHIHLHKEPFSLRTELEDLVSLLRPMAAQKKLLLELHIEEAVGDGFYGDINRLRQIVSNLLSNALKYTEAGWVSLTVTQSHSSTNEAILRFEIEDTGIGIATDALNTIFENFSRLENFETRRNEGAGLGLPIVEALLHKMEGSLFVNSIPGKGSCFSFELPLAQS
ncbi:MAG: ATP-binding protein, partial [Candidatus Thiodiazotropha sp.]